VNDHNVNIIIKSYSIVRIADCKNDNVLLLKRLMYREELAGAAYLFGNIYIVVKGCCNVLVHTGQSLYELIEKITVNGMDAVDICVYILDDGKGQVLKIGQNHDVTTVIDGLECGRLRSMSVANDGRIIILDKGSNVFAYTTDGQSGPSITFGQNVLHAVQLEAEVFVVGTTLVTLKTKLEGMLQTAQQRTGLMCCQHISVDREGNLIVCNCKVHEVVRLNSESLEMMGTLLTLERDGIQNPHHIQYVLENEMMLVSWMNCLDVYSFRKMATQEYLESSKHDIRTQQIHEAELLQRDISNSETFKDLDNIRRSESEYIFSDLLSEVEELPSASSVGEDFLLASIKHALIVHQRSPSSLDHTTVYSFIY